VLSDVPLRILQALEERDDRPPVVHASQGDNPLEADATTPILQGSDEPGDCTSIADLAESRGRVKPDVDAILRQGSDQVSNGSRIANEAESLRRRATAKEIVSGFQGHQKVRDCGFPNCCQGTDCCVLRPFSSASPARPYQGGHGASLANFAE